MMFNRPEDSHKHSLRTLESLYEYDDFMESVASVIDLGCGQALDLVWWATRTTRHDNPEPLNIRCIGLDLGDVPSSIKKYPNISYQQLDFEGQINVYRDSKYDVLWCHDAFQYAIDPLNTLVRWRDIADDNAMLIIILPQTMNIQGKHTDFIQPSGQYYHHSLVSMMHMLALTGWDCHDGFFMKRPEDPWIHTIVYKSLQAPRDPRRTTWYELADSGLLPNSAVKSVMSHGYLRQQDLVLPWLDKNLYSYHKH